MTTCGVVHVGRRVCMLLFSTAFRNTANLFKFGFQSYVLSSYK